MSYDAFKLYAYYALTEPGFNGSEVMEAIGKAVSQTGGTKDFADTRDIAYLIYCQERGIAAEY